MNKPHAIHGLAGTAIRVLTIIAMIAGLVAVGPSLVVAPAHADGENPGVAALSGASITVSPPTPWAAPTTGGTRTLTLTSSVAWTLTGVPAWITASVVKGTGNATVTLTAQPNSIGVARSASLVFTPTGGTAVTLSVTQAPIITPVSWSPATTGGTQVATITTPAAWNLTGFPAWIKPSAVSGTGNGTVTLTAEPNTTGAAHTASLVFTTNGKTVALTVNQTAIITPVSWSPATTGGTQVVTIKTASAWSLTGLPAWVTATAVSGSGNGTVTLTATANTTGSARSASMVFTTGGKTVTLPAKQAPIVTPVSWAAPATGGTRSVTITTPKGWTLTGFPAWIKPSAVSGSGNGTVTLTANPNNTSAARKASLVFTTGGKTVTLTVTQAVVTFAVSPPSWTVPTIGGTQVVTVTSPAGWTLIGLPAWITASASTGTGSGQVTLTATVNNTGSARTGSLVFTPAGGTAVAFPVSQSPVVTPVSWTAPNNGGSKVVTVSTTGAWTLTGLPHWVFATLVRGTCYVILYVQANSTGAARTASLVLTTGGKSVTLTVKQAPFVTPDVWTVPTIGGTQVLTVATSGPWTLTGLPAWMTASAVNGTGNGTVTLTATANTTGETRITDLGFTNSQGIHLRVDQSPIVTPLSWSPRSETTSTVVAVTTPGAWNLTGLPAWITASAVSGTGNGTVTLKALANDTMAARTATLVVTTGGKTLKIAVNQAIPGTQPIDPTISISDTTWDSIWRGLDTTMRMWVDSNTDWYAKFPAWITVTPASGKAGVTYVDLTMDINYAPRPRTGTVTFSVTGKQATVTVNQGEWTTLAVSPSLWQAPMAPMGGARQRIIVTSLTDWSLVEPLPTWILYDGPESSPAGDTVIWLLAHPNTTGASRTGTVSFKAGDKLATVTVKQNGETLSVSPTSWAAPSIGGTQTVKIQTGAPLEVGNTSWITVTPREGTGTFDVTLAAAANNTTAARTGTVQFYSAGKLVTFTVTQAAQVDDCGATATTVCTWANLATGVNGRIEVSGDKDWYKITPTVSGTWTFKSSVLNTGGTPTPSGILRTADGAILASDSVVAEHPQFVLTAKLVAGTTYYLEVRDSGTGAYTVTAVRTT